MENTKVNKLAKEFQQFAFKDAAFSTAIGIMLGIALKDVITSLIDNILMPPIAYITSGIDFSELTFKLGKGDLVLSYGAFINSFVSFLITALVLFLLANIVINGIKRALVKEKKRKKEARKCPYCLSEVNEKATRCQYCTSEIGKK